MGEGSISFWVRKNKDAIAAFDNLIGEDKIKYECLDWEFSLRPSPENGFVFCLIQTMLKTKKDFKISLQNKYKFKSVHLKMTELIELNYDDGKIYAMVCSSEKIHFWVFFTEANKVTQKSS